MEHFTYARFSIRIHSLSDTHTPNQPVRNISTISLLLLEIIELLFASSRQSIIDWFHFFFHLCFHCLVIFVSLSSFNRFGTNRIKLMECVFFFSYDLWIASIWLILILIFSLLLLPQYLTDFGPLPIYMMLIIFNCDRLVFLRWIGQTINVNYQFMTSNWRCSFLYSVLCIMESKDLFKLPQLML